MKCPFCIKVCSKCGEILVANEMNFHKQKGRKYGLRSACKRCTAKQKAEYRANNKEKIAEKKAEYRANNKEKIAKQNAEYRANNKEKIAEQNAEYYKNNKEKIAERNAEYYKNNKEKIAKYQAEYAKTPAGQVSQFNRHCKRRERLQKQGKGITKEQWLEVMRYFNFRCAYTGEVLKEEVRSLDHVNPVAEGGENEIWNLVPCLRKVNSSKKTCEMEEWYKSQPYFDQTRLDKIYEWVEYASSKYKID